MKWRNREMKKFMKLGALLLAIVMVLSMSVTAFADPDPVVSPTATLDGGVAGSVSNNAATALDKSVNISKSIKAFNPTETTVAAPTISYTYAIAPATVTSGSTVSDGTTTVQVKAGPSGATITSSLAWTTNENLTASTTSAGGTDNTKTITADFTAVTFTGAGIYRYDITETVAAGAYAAAGVVDGDSGDSNTAATVNHRYLDVYVKDGSTDGTYDIYGYVLSTTNDTTITSGSNSKTSAFTTDKYYTENLTVSKTVSGDQAMNNHDFPFSVSFTNSTVTAGSKILVYTSEDAAARVAGTALDSTTTNNVASWSDSKGIDSGSSVTYVGIPTGTTVTVYETNDVTGTVYQSTFTVDGNTVQNSSKSITWSSEGDANKSVEATVTTGDAANNHTIAFTNTLGLISPTGVVLRVAPYALMLGVGLFLVLFSRRRKSQAEA